MDPMRQVLWVCDFFRRHGPRSDFVSPEVFDLDDVEVPFSWLYLSLWMVLYHLLFGWLLEVKGP